MESASPSLTSNPSDHGLSACPSLDDVQFAKQFSVLFKSNGARISIINGTQFLMLQWNENTALDRMQNPDCGGQWMDGNGLAIDFDYVREEVVASGDTRDALIASALHYKRLCGMTMIEFLKSGLPISI